jgi:hypothetical protein
MRRVLCLIFLLVISSNAASALEWLDGKRSVMVFSGVFRTGNIPGRAFIPFTKGVEKNYIVGGAFDIDYLTRGDFTFGAEAGIAGRFGQGENTSVEVWAAPGFRYRAFTIGPMTLSTGLYLGLSAVSNTIGVERMREIQKSGDATLLFYIAFEMSLRFQNIPNVEFVVRTHHRSGAWGTLGHMDGGHNANVFGIRYFY